MPERSAEAGASERALRRRIAGFDLDAHVAVTLSGIERLPLDGPIKTTATFSLKPRAAPRGGASLEGIRDEHALQASDPYDRGRNWPLQRRL